MAFPDPLDLVNECLSLIEQAPDEKEASQLRSLTIRLLQIADEEFARYGIPTTRDGKLLSVVHAAGALGSVRSE